MLLPAERQVPSWRPPRKSPASRTCPALTWPGSFFRAWTGCSKLCFPRVGVFSDPEIFNFPKSDENISTACWGLLLLRRIICSEIFMENTRSSMSMVKQPGANCTRRGQTLISIWNQRKSAVSVGSSFGWIKSNWLNKKIPYISFNVNMLLLS